MVPAPLMQAQLLDLAELAALVHSLIEHCAIDVCIMSVEVDECIESGCSRVEVRALRWSGGIVDEQLPLGMLDLSDASSAAASWAESCICNDTLIAYVSICVCVCDVCVCMCVCVRHCLRTGDSCC